MSAGRRMGGDGALELGMTPDGLRALVADVQRRQMEHV